MPGERPAAPMPFQQINLECWWCGVVPDSGLVGRAPGVLVGVCIFSITKELY